MLLSKNCKYVLDCLIENPPAATSDIYETFIWAQFIDKNKMDYAAYSGTLETLSNQKYIIWVDDTHTKFLLTETGRNYKEFSRLEKKCVWINRIISFLLGLLTAVIVEILI